jgi:hypothetical protein
MVRYARCKAYFNPTHSKDCGKKKKPEITDDYTKFMCAMERANQMLHCYPCSRKPVNWTQKCVLLLLQMAALNSYIAQTMHCKPKAKGHGLRFQGLLHT